jgi:hypothetical protein
VDFPEPRSLNESERRVLNYMLSPDFPGVEVLRNQVDGIQVVSSCDCGCPTIDFRVGSNVQRWSGRYSSGTIPVTGLIQAPDGNSTGIIVFVRDGAMTSLEMYSTLRLIPSEWPASEEIALVVES